MGRIITVANHKGGVAKTSTVANVGGVLANMGKRVLMLDLDAQGNLTDYYLKERTEDSIFDSMTKGSPLYIIQVKENLYIVPGSVKMAELEARTANSKERADILRQKLEQVKDSYDYILIDCPPSLGIVTLNALIASEGVIIPLTAETIPLSGLKMLLDVIEAIKERKNPNLSISGILLTRWTGTNLNRDIESSLRGRFGETVFKTKIRQNVSIAEAPSFRLEVAEYSPKSNGAKDYISLTKEIIKRIK